MALNYAYNNLKNDFDYLFFMDHDLFPIKNFSIEEILGDNIIAGCEQIISNKRYLWPGCIMFTNLNEDFDFTPVNGLDTGGRLSDFINNNKDKTLILNYEATQINLKLNNYFMHEFYDIVHDGTFMHFIKASNWCNVDIKTFNVRQNHLFSILDNYIK